MTITVPGVGPKPCLVLLCGEMPGREEANRGRPFVGKSGKEQESYLNRYGASSQNWYKTNVCKTYIEGNPDPTPALIREWTPTLYRELAEVQPRVILAVGRYAMRWFLGAGAGLQACHGLPHRAGAFDASLQDRGGPNNAIIIPIHHPAGGFYNNDKRAVINWDYEQACRVVRDVLSGRDVAIRRDEHQGREQYWDAAGAEVAQYLAGKAKELGRDLVVGLDTEGSIAHPWSVQISASPGTGVTLRYSQSDFALGAAAIQKAADNGALIALHNASTPQGCLWDVQMCQAMGIDLTRAQLWDTMYASYLLRLEPQGLKALAYRWCGMRMEDYKRLISGVGADRQLEYLAKVLDLPWPKVEPQLVQENDGTSRVYTPKHVHKRVEKFLVDYGTFLLESTGGEDEEEDPDKESDDTDFLYKRWQNMDLGQRKAVESVLGPMPTTTLDDMPFERAVWYASRDPDATLRLYYRLSEEIKSRGLLKLMETGMKVLPVFYEMQQTGLPVSRQAFIDLRDGLTKDMEKLQSRIQHRYYDGRPFNPGSDKQFGAIIRRRGLESLKKTPKGTMSVGKQAVEHLRYVDPAVADIIEWREKEHIRSMFCGPVLDLLPENLDSTLIKCKIKPTRTPTRRIASQTPNFLGFPKHDKPNKHDYGKQVRSCFVCPPGEIFLEVDLSQIEVRFLAHESADPLMCRLFSEIDPETGEPRDVHTETAARIFGMKVSDVGKKSVERSFAKRVSFGIAYGVSGSGLAAQLRMGGVTGWDDRKCDRLIKEWLKLYKGAAAYFERIEQEVLKTGVVRDCWGMPRYLPGVWSDDPKVAAEARRQAVNHRIQGGAQGLLQTSMVWLKQPIRELQEAGLNVKWLLTVHDSLLFQVDENYAEDLAPLVVEAMTMHNGMKLRIPVLADWSTAKSWGIL